MNDTLPIAFRQIINALEEIEEKHKIRYYIVGGILANNYTVFRATQDIDFVVDTDKNDFSVNQYISFLKQYDFVPIQDWSQTELLAKEIGMIQFFDKNERVKFDNYFVVRNDSRNYKKLGPISVKRRVRAIIFGIECWIASKEDFILSKLVYGGWQDYSDALGCWMRFQEELDLSYLREKARDLDVFKEFNLLQSGIEDPDEYFERLHDS